MSTKCFFVKPSTKVKRYFRRYEDGSCDEKSYHNGVVLCDEIQIPVPKDGYENDRKMIGHAPRKNQIKNFPPKCDSCGHVFSANASNQLFSERLYIREDSGELFSLRNLPAGAMYYADWILTENSNLFRGPDNHCLIAVTPDGFLWTIDGPASNCTLPDDKEHKCWVRRGDVPNITVDKNGLTCSAGAGSIQTPNWHGFLENGEFVLQRTG